MQTVHAGVGLATIQRAIMHFEMTTNVSAPQAGGNFMAVGIAVITEDAFTASALPDPEVDFNQDWYYWTRRQMIPTTTETNGMVTWDVDIRTRRKLRGGYVLAMVVQTSTQEVALDLDVSMRLLWNQTA